MRALFGSSPRAGATARLGDIRWKVIEASPAVKKGLYDELVARKLFPRSPESTRVGWKKTGVIVMIAAVALGLIGILAEGWWAVFPAVVAVGLGEILYRLGKSMPRKTSAGAESAAKWRAFRRYLDNIEGYEKVSESRQIFDKYLAYAVAFGIDTAWVRTFAAVETPAPGWFAWVGDVFTSPSSRPSGRYGGWSTGSGLPVSGGGVDLPDIDLPKMPSVQGASDRASSGLQSGSSGSPGLLNVAGALFAILDAFSGGGEEVVHRAAVVAVSADAERLSILGVPLDPIGPEQTRAALVRVPDRTMGRSMPARCHAQSRVRDGGRKECGVRDRHCRGRFDHSRRSWGSRSGAHARCGTGKTRRSGDWRRPRQLARRQERTAVGAIVLIGRQSRCRRASGRTTPGDTPENSSCRLVVGRYGRA